MNSIAVAILVKDEERCIERCLDSVIGLFDEYLIIDSGSTDNTLAIIQRKISGRSLNCHLYHAGSSENFATLRNIAIQHAVSDAIFFIDADEVFISSKEQVYDFFSELLLSEHADATALCPVIENHDGHCITTLPRGFFLRGDYEYVGYVHEELRKKNANPVSHLCVDIRILHDGYRDEVIAGKDKLRRNLPLNIKNVEFEPENPRWIYFYVRDAFDIHDRKIMYQQLKNAIVINNTQPLCKTNVIDSIYTFKIIDLMVRLHLIESGDDAEFSVMINLMNEMAPANSNAFFYQCLRPLMRWKKEELLTLQLIANFNQRSEVSHHGMLHSQGFHIDSLLAAYLYEAGFKNKATDVLNSLTENGYQNFLTREYMSE